MSPLHAAEDANRPLVKALLSNPVWRARYLAHVRTITTTWLDWEKIGPVFEKYHQLIDADVRRDRKRLYGYAEFQRSLGSDDAGNDRRRSTSLKSFVTERSRFLLAHPQLKGPWPEIAAVTHEAVPGEEGKKQLRVKARVGNDVALDQVLLYFKRKRLDPYRAVKMFDDGKHGDGAAGDGVFAADTAAFVPKNRIRYYVEARARQDIGTTTFHPAKAEASPIRYRF